MTKEKWLENTLKQLSLKGIDVLTIDTLCKTFKLTKGSFYHHFKNHDLFIDELLNFWNETYTLQIVNEIKKYENNVLKQIEVINEMIYSKDLNIEVQFRILGFKNKKVQKYIKNIDTERLEILKINQKKLVPNNSEEEIDLMASCIYSQFIGSLFILPKMPIEKIKKMDTLFLDLFLKTNY